MRLEIMNGKRLLALSLVINALALAGVGALSLRGDVAGTYFPYLAPRIQAVRGNDILINFMPLRLAVRAYADAQPERIGIYFEYLPSGVSIGVNDREQFAVASLLKVPVVMGIEKLIDENALSYDTQLTIKSDDLDRRFGDGWKQGEGTSLTVRRAIDLTLQQSDNTAFQLLVDALYADNDHNLTDVFDSLDIPVENEGQKILITPKSYSSIFRSLYLSSYLPLERSDALLETMTRTIFSDKLPAGVPQGVPVAHKIGVYETPGDSPVYSDCGIVYVPSRPYILCVMVQSDEDTARRHIVAVSKFAYEYVSAQQKREEY